MDPSKLENIDIKVFNWAVDLGHKMIDRGYAQAWFNWLEWIGLTSFIYVIARHLDSIFLFGISIISTLVLFFVGLAGIEKLRDDILPTLKGGIWIILLVCSALSIAGLLIVVNILFKLLPASLP